MKPLLFFLFFFNFSLSAQSDGYFGNWQESSLEQKWQVFDSFDAWKAVNETYSNQGFRPIDFEYYKEDGQDKYFCLWEENGGVGYYWYYWDNMDSWLNTNTDLTQNQSVKLIDFEKISINGRDMYFGIWFGDQTNQETKIANSIAGFIGFNNEFREKGMLLSEMEFYETNGIVKYFGTWHPATNNQIQKSKLFITLDDLEVYMLELQETDPNFTLVEFEECKSQQLDATFYIGFWENKEIEHKVIAANDFSEWNFWEDRFISESPRRLVDFEKFTDEDFYPILPKERIIKDEDLVAGGIYNWTKDTTYFLEGTVNLEESGVLNIEAGTVVKAISNEESETCSSLNILEGAQIIANGTKEEPIQFISTPYTFDYSLRNRGIWKGITIEGKPNLCSGELSYVTIQHAGQKTNSQEVGALTLNNVDSCMAISHLEIIDSGSDGIQLRGGNVNLAYTSVTFIDDDAFDWDLGWSGNGIYWFVYMGQKDYNEQDSLKDYAIEAKGNLVNSEPNHHPIIYNGTFVGNSCFENIDNEAAIIFKENGVGIIANSIITDFPQYAIKIEDKTGNNDSYQQLEQGNIQLLNNVFWNIREGNQLDASENGILLSSPNGEDEQAVFLSQHLLNNSNSIKERGLAANRFSDYCLALDPRPHPQSNYKVLANAPYPNNSFFSLKPTANQKGAFEDESIWLNTWASLASLVVLGDFARLNYIYKDSVVLNGDTIRIFCEDLPFFQDDFFIQQVCPGPFGTGQVAGATRKGNKRKRPKNLNIPEEIEWQRFRTPNSPEEEIAYIEEWTYFGRTTICDFLDTIDIVLIIQDTTPPIIHLIPDVNGNISAFPEDCDEANITEITRDTLQEASEIVVVHTFKAEDYSGNKAERTVRELLNGTPEILFADMDKDGFGNPEISIPWIGALVGFVSNDLDCNDDNANAFPNKEITLNETIVESVDLDCSGGENYDICGNAFELSVGQTCNEVSVGSFGGSSPTIYPDLPNNCEIARNYRDIWFRAKVPNSGKISFLFEVIQFNESEGVNVEIFNGSCTNLNFIDCFSGALPLTVWLENQIPDEYLYLRVTEVTNNSYAKVRICALEQAVTNSLCSGAIPVVVDNESLCSVDTFSNAGTPFGINRLESDCYLADERYRKSIWFSFVPITLSPISIEVKEIEGSLFSNYSSRLQLFRKGCNSLQEADCAATIGDKLILSDFSDLSIGEEFFFRIVPYDRDEGEFILEICQEKEEINTTTSTNNIEKEIDFQLIPNPTSSKGEIITEIRLPESTNIILGLFNLQGQKINTTIRRQVVGNKTYKIPMTIGDIPSGIYLVSLQTENERVVKKLVVSH